MTRVHVWGWLGLMVVLQGCPTIPSLKNYTKGWVGRPIEELKEVDALPSVYDDYAMRIGWQETTYRLDNGNWVYVQLDSKDCFIHWEVNPQGIIVGSRTEGKGCRWQ